MYYYHCNELYHHGILGMHWGIRRYQPYPKGKKGGKEVGEAAKKSQNYSKSATSISKTKNRLSDQELQSAVKRLNLERQLDNFSYEEKMSGVNRIDRAVKTVGKITTWAVTGTAAYNQIAKIYNSFHGKKKLPTIG